MKSTYYLHLSLSCYIYTSITIHLYSIHPHCRRHSFASLYTKGEPHFLHSSNGFFLFISLGRHTYQQYFFLSNASSSSLTNDTSLSQPQRGIQLSQQLLNRQPPAANSCRLNPRLFTGHRPSQLTPKQSRFLLNHRYIHNEASIL